MDNKESKQEVGLMWLGILVSVLAAAAIGLIYMISAVGKFPGIIALSKENKKLGYLIAFIVIAVCFVIVAFIFSTVNAVIIFLHVILFRLLFGLIGMIIKACGFSGADAGQKFYWQGWLSLLACVIYLAVAWYLCHHVWKTEYSLKTDKKIGELTIAVFADSHIGTTFDGEGFAAHMEEIMKESPDIVVIPGDFVDDNSKKEDMITACEALGKMNPKYGVWYVFGNHDRGYFNNRDFTADELIGELEKNKVHVLVDETVCVEDLFYIVGREDKYDEKRKDIKELTEGLDPDKYVIVLDHQPNDYAAEAEAGVDLVLSGHTHGGQFFPVTKAGEWMKANDRTYGHEKRENTDFIVTSGISDWEIYFKTGTKSEYVIVKVEGEK